MSSKVSSPDLLRPFDIIFSCAICQKPISELYRRPQTDHGFSSGSGTTERVVTRLWLTGCGHLTCNDHLEGGGVPFHPQGERPHSICPVCEQDKGDRTPKPLFGIVSGKSGEHDKDIPQKYFDVPPTNLNGNGNTMSAIRFQYLSLIRFGGSMAKRYQDASRAEGIAKAQVDDLATSLRDIQDEVAKMRARIDELQIIEKKYQKYKSREPEIRHYLGSCAGLAEENNQLKNELRYMGCDVPPTTWKFGTKRQTSRDVEQNPSRNASSSSRKRMRQDYESIEDESMPPPPITQHPLSSKPAIDIYSDKSWRPARASDEDDKYLMSGALLPRRGHRNSQINEDLAESARYEQVPIHEGRFERNISPTKKQVRNQHLFDPVIQARNRRSNKPFTDPYGRAHPASRSSVVRRSILPPLSRGNWPEGQNDYHLETARHNMSLQDTRQDALMADKTDSVSQHYIRAIESPFLNLEAQPQRQALRTPTLAQAVAQPEHLVSDLGRLHMDKLGCTPPMAQSLNALSFIQEPYTTKNHPVYTRPPSRTLLSRAAFAQQPAPTSQLDWNRRCLYEPLAVTSRASVAPDIGKSWNPNSQRPGMRLNTLRGVKGGSLQPSGASYNSGTVAQHQRFPHQQYRDTYTVGSRRSVRR